MKKTPIFLIGLFILFLLFLVNVQSAKAVPLAGANADMDQVAADNAGVFTDETADANSVGVNDVQICGALSMMPPIMG